MTALPIPPFYLKPGTVEIVGLSGKGKSGKNHLARVALLPRGYFPISLAAHFKVEAVVKDGAPIDEVFFGDKSPATRDMLQKRGTEEGRNVFGEQHWLKTLEAWIASYASAGWHKFVVTDVRFPNEVEWVQSLGGRVYRVIGRGGLDGVAAQHPSETALDTYRGFDAWINNEPAVEAHTCSILDALIDQHFVGTLSSTPPAFQPTTLLTASVNT